MNSYSDDDHISTGSVGRAVFGSGQWKKIEKGKPPQDVFINPKYPYEISVFILDTTSDEKLADIGNNMAQSRGQGRKFYGWAELPVNQVNTSERKVYRAPTPDNQWHANIILSIKKEDELEWERHINDLVLMTQPRPSPYTP